MTSMEITGPTPYQELNSILHRLVGNAQQILGNNFTGAYLQGSFAIGDFDQDSDVDFLIVIEAEISESQLAALQTMHANIYDLDSRWARHLEGSYVPKDAIRRYDPEGFPFLYLDNGSNSLIRSHHDNTLVVRWVTRERGITLVGPEPKRLIDFVPADDLRQEVLGTMRTWADRIFADPEQMNNGWYQPFAVLSYCRMLHTLQTGTVESKLAGARWGQRALDGRWTGLIQRAWDERTNQFSKVDQKANPDDFKRTLDFIRYALDRSLQVESGNS